MASGLIRIVLLCASLSAQVNSCASAKVDDEVNPGASSAQSVNSVIEWNTTPLVIVRTPWRPLRVTKTQRKTIGRLGMKLG
jgi:hypothetical protein